MAFIKSSIWSNVHSLLSDTKCTHTHTNSYVRTHVSGVMKLFPSLKLQRLWWSREIRTVDIRWARSWKVNSWSAKSISESWILSTRLQLSFWAMIAFQNSIHDDELPHIILAKGICAKNGGAFTEPYLRLTRDKRTARIMIMNAIVISIVDNPMLSGAALLVCVVIRVHRPESAETEIKPWLLSEKAAAVAKTKCAPFALFVHRQSSVEKSARSPASAGLISTEYQSQRFDRCEGILLNLPARKLDTSDFSLWQQRKCW